MIAPIRDLGSITSKTLSIRESTLNMTASNNMNMKVDSFNWLFQGTNDFFDEVQGCSLAQSAHSPRTSSISSSKCEEGYAEHLEKQNDKIDEDDPAITSNNEPSNSSQWELEYETSKSQGHISKAANSTNAAC